MLDTFPFDFDQVGYTYKALKSDQILAPAGDTSNRKQADAFPGQFWVSTQRQIEDTFDIIRKSGVLLKDQYDLRKYLNQFPEISGVLSESCQLTRELFERTTQLSLEMYEDPESDDRHPVLYVRQKDYEKNILEKIDGISEQLDPMLKVTEGWFLITTDFANLE